MQNSVTNGQDIMIYRGQVFLRSDRPPGIFFSNINSFRFSCLHDEFIICDYFNAKFKVKKLQDLQEFHFTSSNHIYVISES